MPKPATPDLSEFTRLAKKTRYPCRVAEILEKLPDDERAQLVAALAQDKGVIPLGAISAWLGKRGHKIHQQGLYPHRAGRCSCYDD